jgi:hypothetical protein
MMLSPPQGMDREQQIGKETPEEQSKPHDPCNPRPELFSNHYQRFDDQSVGRIWYSDSHELWTGYPPHSYITLHLYFLLQQPIREQQRIRLIKGLLVGAVSKQSPEDYEPLRRFRFIHQFAVSKQAVGLAHLVRVVFRGALR